MFTSNERVFESRQLKGYGVYVADSELVEGRTYFQTYCLDKDGHIPQLDAVVFIGPDRAKGDDGRLYFQDAASYLAGVRFDSATKDDAEFHAVDRGTPFVMDFEHALNGLLRCSLERRDAGL